MDCKKGASEQEVEKCRIKEKEDEEKKEAIQSCVENNHFSSMVREETGSSALGTIAEVAEFAAPTSLALDIHAYSLKTTRDFWRGSGKEWSSGFNWAAKRLSNFVGGPRLLGYAKVVGDKVSVPTAVVGAFTLGYNASIVAQCYTGVLK